MKQFEQTCGDESNFLFLVLDEQCERIEIVTDSGPGCAGSVVLDKAAHPKSFAAALALMEALSEESDGEGKL